jgi:phosphomethylpyrimidine synthase
MPTTFAPGRGKQDRRPRPDVARGLPGAADRTADEHGPANLNWETHLGESLDPPTAARMHPEACGQIEGARPDAADYCSMCGQHWCSVRINRQVREAIRRQPCDSEPRP